MSIADLPFIRRTRRNHAIEHATIHILSETRPRMPFAGRADTGGFFVIGDVPADDVERAVEEAIERLKDEPDLAVHPFCGTNLVVGGMVGAVASVAAIATIADKRSRSNLFEILPRLMIAGTFSSLIAQPLGQRAQKHFTTLPETHDVQFGGITTTTKGGRTIHRVSIEEIRESVIDA